MMAYCIQLGEWLPNAAWRCHCCCRSSHIEEKDGVDGGIRTLDLQGHNLAR